VHGPVMSCMLSLLGGELPRRQADFARCSYATRISCHVQCRHCCNSVTLCMQSTERCCCRLAGTGLQRFALVLHVAEQPAWLKAVVLQLSLLRPLPKQLPDQTKPLLPSFRLSNGQDDIPQKGSKAAEDSAASASRQRTQLQTSAAGADSAERLPSRSAAGGRQAGRRRTRTPQLLVVERGRPRFARLPASPATASADREHDSPEEAVLHVLPAAHSPEAIVSCAGTTSGAVLRFQGSMSPSNTLLLCKTWQNYMVPPVPASCILFAGSLADGGWLAHIRLCYAGGGSGRAGHVTSAGRGGGGGGGDDPHDDSDDEGDGSGGYGGGDWSPPGGGSGGDGDDWSRCGVTSLAALAALVSQCIK